MSNYRKIDFSSRLRKFQTTHAFKNFEFFIKQIFKCKISVNITFYHFSSVRRHFDISSLRRWLLITYVIDLSETLAARVFIHEYSYVENSIESKSGKLKIFKGKVHAILTQKIVFFDSGSI